MMGRNLPVEMMKAISFAVAFEDKFSGRLKEGQGGHLQTEERRCSLVGPVADEATKARKGFCANMAHDETIHDG
ncbi:hypothetical protein Vadar_001690 [Vaccinium darrowii]|uniref:Uncharacterized protein n=1 Tax=Vaccinium darrowii TaxID=229202 RepID=A0ACB7XMT5_9ERIC|nr:hypothetical protein Vadar_001690 [Vaccinium darrowii]